MQRGAPAIEAPAWGCNEPRQCENGAAGGKIHSRFEFAIQSLVCRTLLRKVFNLFLLLRPPGAPHRACRYLAAGVPSSALREMMAQKY